MADKRDPEEIDFESVETEQHRRGRGFLVAGGFLVTVLAGLFLFFSGGRDAPEEPARAPKSGDTVESQRRPLRFVGERRDRREQEAPEEATTVFEETIVEGPAEPEETAAPEPDGTGETLPDIDGSDDFVAAAVAALPGVNMLPSSWIGAGDLVRRFVVVVDNIAEGETPRRHLSFMKIVGRFPVVESEGGVYLDPAGYHRYDAVAGFFSSLDAEACAGVYRALSPLFEEAYRDLGYPDRPFDKAMGKAVRRLGSVRFPVGEIFLLRGEGVFHFEDPDLENLSAPEKHLLRMGPENAEKVMSFLEDFANALGLGK